MFDAFKAKTAAQMAAYLLNKAGGSMPKLKLMKLMYLADREGYRDDNGPEPFLWDTVVAMKNGPVLAKTLELMEGRASDSKDWDELIAPKGDGELALRRDLKYFNPDEFVPDLKTWVKTDNGKLCPALEKILDDILAQFGNMDQWDLVEYTHTLGEWHDPGEEAVPIEPKEILKAMGRTPEEIGDILLYLEDSNKLDAALAYYTNE
jgi:uncharacterized phage-associated protein